MGYDLANNLFFVMAVFAALVFVARLFYRTEHPTERDPVGESLEEPDEAEAVDAQPARPKLHILPAEWALILDSWWDARCTDLDLLFLEAELLEMGIATFFLPWRPGQHFGPTGPQFPVQMFVDFSRLDEARLVMADLLSLDPSDNYQPRMANPNMNVPGDRELLALVSGFRRRARISSGWWAVAWWVFFTYFLVNNVVSAL